MVNMSYIPNSTLDSLVLDRVVSLNFISMGILCLIIAVISGIIFYVMIRYLKQNPIDAQKKA
jgi:hypothetical protein